MSKCTSNKCNVDHSSGTSKEVKAFNLKKYKLGAKFAAVASGIVPCEVEDHYGAWLVKFRNDKSVLLQTDYDKAAFAVDAGVIAAPSDWDGTPSSLGESWVDLDTDSINHCPDYYLDVAE